MATLIGVLVDVSGSMRASIFKAIEGLIKNESDESANHVFALAFGASEEPQAFDLLGTLERLAKRPLEGILEEILTFLEQNGAPRVRTWAKIGVLLEAVEISEACSFLYELKHNDTFRRTFVQDCLPETCRKLTHSLTSYAIEVLFWAAQLIPGAQEYATRGSVEEVVAKGKDLLPEVLEIVPIGQDAIMDVHKASKILHGGIGEDELTDERVDELMDAVETFIYGGRPLMRTIDEAKKLFATPRFKDHAKLMFIISDGEPAHGNNPPMKELAELGVTTVCCYITNDVITDPKRLYSTPCQTWDRAAKIMFRMSSTITTQRFPRNIFVKRGWNIDNKNNEIRLLVQVNHPDIIKDVCELARAVVAFRFTMASLIGVLVDVSGSMKASIGERPNEKDTQKASTWARSIFKVVEGLIKHESDVSSANHVFALAFGATKEPQAFDLLGTLAPLLERTREMERLANWLLKGILEEILTFLENNGAPRVRTWANMEVLYQVVERSVACSFLYELKRNHTFRRKFVQDCLPESCRKLTRTATSYALEVMNFGASYIPSVQEYATKGSVEEVVAKGKELLVEVLEMVPIGQKAIMDVQKASKILHGGIGEEELTDKRVDELMDAVEPFIYGGTPLMGTIDKAKKLFATPGFKDHTKLMFIISDGEPGDGNNPPMKKLAELGVNTVCCYITKDAITDPKRLYSTPCQTWDKAAKLMFRISSTITTQKIPRTIFVKRGWNIDITNNEIRLFVQVNHPDIIKDVCDLARDVVCCQDALSDLLTTVSLDLYINQANQGFVPKKQKGGTCYANASAAVLHLSMQRIVGRDGGYPDFFKLREKIIKKYGEDSASTLQVLQEICPEYRLHCKEVDTLGAMKAITAKRPVLARFRLTDPEWATFDDFYRQNPRGILTSAVLDIKRRPPGQELIGHAVVLTSFNSESLRLMNSWGSPWADGGFFKVSNTEVLGLKFVDVFWTEEDLKQSEIDAYQRHGPTIAQTMFSRLQGLQTVQYPCPSCKQSSNVADFSGHHLEALCPKCRKRFKIKEAGDDLVLSMYLLSLSASGA